MGIRRFETSGPISRVLSSGLPNGWSFIWDAGYPTPLAAYPSIIARRAISLLLFGLAPNGVYRAALVAESRGGLLPHRFTLARCTKIALVGGLFSVALSIGSPRLGVTQHLALWSSDFPHPKRDATIRPARNILTF